METKLQSVEEYYRSLPAERLDCMNRLRKTINEHLPEGFSEGFDYGMPGWSVPHTLYPIGYHCNPKIPLPFLGIASQKNFVSIYHMGIYASPELMNWFFEAYPKHCSQKLDMGKSCIRFKKPENIPYELIGELSEKMTPQDWIALYEKAFRK